MASSFTMITPKSGFPDNLLPVALGIICSPKRVRVLAFLVYQISSLEVQTDYLISFFTTTWILKALSFTAFIIYKSKGKVSALSLWLLSSTVLFLKCKDVPLRDEQI